MHIALRDAKFKGREHSRVSTICMSRAVSLLKRNGRVELIFEPEKLIGISGVFDNQASTRLANCKAAELSFAQTVQTITPISRYGQTTSSRPERRWLLVERC